MRFVPIESEAVGQRTPQGAQLVDRRTAPSIMIDLELALPDDIHLDVVAFL
jgi:hypothetical protein